MKTSPSQFEVLVEFMEQHGDLSKPFDGPQGRLSNLNLWANLSQALNADGTGEPKTTDKWRRVWSDLKNNTKRKAAKIHQAITGTGGGPACKLSLSDLENRVIGIMGPQAAIGMAEVVEVGLVQDNNTILEQEVPGISTVVEQQPNIESPANWSQPGTSSNLQWLEVPVAPETPVQSSERPGLLTSPPPPPPPPPRSAHASPRRRRLVARRRISSSPRSRPATQAELTRQQFVRSDTEWRAFQQEKEKHQHELEVERLRLREVELQQQARWQELFAEFLSIMSEVAKKYIEKND